MAPEKIPAPAVDLKNPYLAGLLAFLVPGLGHYYQGRRGKAILYAACILGLYAIGLALGDGKIVFWRWVNPLRDSENFRLQFLGQFWVGLPGVLAVLQASLLHYDHGTILGGFLSEPSLQVINGLHHRLGKLIDVGTVYTTIAGLLNILAIYDALEGPAQAGDDEAVAPQPSKAEVPVPEPSP